MDKRVTPCLLETEQPFVAPPLPKMENKPAPPQQSQEKKSEMENHSLENVSMVGRGYVGKRKTVTQEGKLSPISQQVKDQVSQKDSAIQQSNLFISEQPNNLQSKISASKITANENLSNSQFERLPTLHGRINAARRTYKPESQIDHMQGL
jgi:hypothetical protein